MEKLQKANIPFVTSIHLPSAWNNSAPTGQIFMKLVICGFFFLNPSSMIET